jgi:adenylate kinase
VILAISGTPGTGKSALGGVLRSKGWNVLELNLFAQEHGLLGAMDRKRRTRAVDPKALDKAVLKSKLAGDVALIGHLAHLLTVDKIIVLRCRPSVLEIRLRDRGYAQSKVRENLEAEGCDVILVEALDRSHEVYEIDTSERTPEEAAEAVAEILAGEKEKYAPGHIDWSEEVLSWY